MEQNRLNEAKEFRFHTMGSSKSVIGVNHKNRQKVNFISAAEAGRNLKISQSHIIACCKGKRFIAGGYSWRYNNEF
jgi:hypothetical protein